MTRSTHAWEMFDMLAERYGQADWQRLRATDPETFFRAKCVVESITDRVRFRVHKVGLEPYMFDLEAKGEKTLCFRVDLQYLLDEDNRLDDLLLDALRQLAHEVQKQWGERLTVRVLKNRSAYERHLRGTP